MSEENTETERVVEKRSEKMTDLMPTPQQKRADLFKLTPDFMKRAIKLEKTMLVDYHSKLVAGGLSDTDMAQFIRQYVNLTRRKLKQGRKWSTEAVHRMLDEYKAHFEKKEAERLAEEAEEAETTEPVVEAEPNP